MTRPWQVQLDILGEWRTVSTCSSVSSARRVARRERFGRRARLRNRETGQIVESINSLAVAAFLSGMDVGEAAVACKLSIYEVEEQIRRAL